MDTVNQKKTVSKKNLKTSAISIQGLDVTKDAIITFSKVTKDIGILTKIINLDGDGKLVKDHSECTLSLGEIKIVKCTIEQFASSLRTTHKGQALVHGVSQHDNAIICSRDKLGSVRADKPGSNVITRRKKYLKYPDGHGLLMLDHDTPRSNAIVLDDKAINSLSPEKLIEAIEQIFPEIKTAAWVSTPSTSSCIYDSAGKELSGEGDGFHSYLFPKNAQDIERFMDVLGKRLILAGYGRIEFSKTGSMLVRTIIDLAVGSPERLDFIAGAYCRGGLEQRLPEPHLHRGSLLDTQLLQDLTDNEQSKYNEIIRDLKNKAEPIHKKLQNQYCDEKVKGLTASGMDPETAKKNVTDRLNGVLDDELVLYLEGGKNITVGELLNDGPKYDGANLADPLEPEYGGWSRNKAQFYWNKKGKPRIHSFAHGTTTYKFSRYDVKIAIVRKKVYLPPITNPIDPNKFADKMTQRIQSLNPLFYCGGKIKDGFIQYAETYNYCIKLNASGDTRQLIVPAPTGSGKTVSACLYLSEIAKIGLSGLLVVSEVSVAKEMASAINELAGDTVAGVHHSISEKHPKHELWCDIDNLPRITVITHSMFIQRSDSGKNIEELRKFKGRQRDIVIIDERIDLIKRVSFGTNEINDAIAILKRDKRLHDYAEMLANCMDIVFIKSTVGSLRYTPEIERLHNDIRNKIYTLTVDLSSESYNLTQQLRGRKRNPATDKANLIDLLRRMIYVIGSRYSHTPEGSNVVCHREENLSDKFGSVVVLDATSNVNPEYDYRTNNNHNIMCLTRSNSRNYSNVTIHICTAKEAKQSKHVIYNRHLKEKNLDAIVACYLELIGSILKPADKLLVVTFMDMVPLFNDKSPYGDQVKFIYWGSKDARGSNEYSDFNKALIIGWYRKPNHVYVQSVMAINQFDKYICSNGSVWSDANHLKDMLIVDDMIQFLNRVRCRTAIDDKGNCKQVDLYCLTGGNEEMEQIIKTTIKNEMPNITIKTWEPNSLKALKQKQTKTEKRAENIMMYLRGKIERYEEISLLEIRGEFKLKAYI